MACITTEKGKQIGGIYSKIAPTTSDLTVINPDTGKEYIKGKFLGKGGFAKCYELTDKCNGEVYAGKIVPKDLLVKPHQKDKMAQEIDIHRSLSHKHVVGFHGFFEDSSNVYILLELCKRRVN
jgi:polo-like kinase 1